MISYLLSATAVQIIVFAGTPTIVVTNIKAEHVANIEGWVSGTAVSLLGNSLLKLSWGSFALKLSWYCRELNAVEFILQNYKRAVSFSIFQPQKGASEAYLMTFFLTRNLHICLQTNETSAETRLKTLHTGLMLDYLNPLMNTFCIQVMYEISIATVLIKQAWNCSSTFI